MIRWIIYLAIFGLLDLYAFQAFKTVSKNNWIRILYWLITALVIGNFIFHYYGLNRRDGFSHVHAYAFGFFIVILVPF